MMVYLEYKPGSKFYYVETCHISDKKPVIELIQESGYGNSSWYKHNGIWWNYNLFTSRERGDEHHPLLDPQGSIDALDRTLKEVKIHIRNLKLGNFIQ
jgi:hypothetical protein